MFAVPVTPKLSPKLVSESGVLRLLASRRVAGTVPGMDTLTSTPRGVHTDPDGVEWWTLEAVAAALCCSTRTARRWTRRAGFPPAYRLGPSTVRWRADDVRAWREDQRRSEALATPAEWRPAERATARHGRRGPRRAA